MASIRMTRSRFRQISSVKNDIAILKKQQHKNLVFSHESEHDVEDFDDILLDRKKSRWEPILWRVHLQNIEEMRKNRTAPVDSMGCSELADINAHPKLYRFQVLLSLMLSSQTKDQVTSTAMERLIKFGCSIENILSYSDDQLEQLLIPVCFYKTKSRHIKRTAAILKQNYDCDIPNSVSKLCTLPGVGPKMAHLVMQIAWGKVTGIAVDTHVHRVANRLGWVSKMTKTPGETRIILEDWMPKNLWRNTNKLLVGFGQEICKSIRPKCNSCLNKNDCPYGKLQT